MNVSTLHLLLNNLRGSHFDCHCLFTSNYWTFSFKVCLMQDERLIGCFNGSPFTAQPSLSKIVGDVVCLNRDGYCETEIGQIPSEHYWNLWVCKRLKTPRYLTSSKDRNPHIVKIYMKILFSFRNKEFFQKSGFQIPNKPFGKSLLVFKLARLNHTCKHTPIQNLMFDFVNSPHKCPRTQLGKGYVYISNEECKAIFFGRTKIKSNGVFLLV